MQDFIFLLILLAIFLGAALVAFAKQIVTSVFGLLLTLASVAGIYVFLSADFIAVSQVLIYIGGVVILLLFAVMLTGRSAGELSVTNPAMQKVPALLFSFAFFAISIYVIFTSGLDFSPANYQATTAAIGHLLLREFILPFEYVSFVIVVLLVGSAVLIRKELVIGKEEKPKEDIHGNIE